MAAGALHRVVAALIGVPVALEPELARRYPELRRVHWRQGGLPPRVAGWCIGQRSVAAVTLGTVVFLGRNVPQSAHLLLHELRHVEQFASSRLFALHYLWELRRGYHDNRFEVDARAYAARRVAERASHHPLTG